MPVVEEYSGDDTVILNWNIENFSLHTCVMGKPVLSPEFEVKNLRDSYWQLELFPSGSNNFDYIACYVRAIENSRSQYESFSLTLSLRVGHINLFEAHETWTSINSVYWKCDEFIRRDLLRPGHLRKNIFSIRCIIQPERSDITINYIQEFKYLSQNLISLLDSEKHHDLVLMTDDNKLFKVHKCIMSVRWPSLPIVLKSHLDFEVNYSDCGPVISVHNTNSDTLETMIRYVYSGAIDGHNPPRDVYRASEKLGFDTLRKNLTSYPKTYFGVTKIITDHKTVTWHLDDVRSWDTKPPSFTRILPVTELHQIFEIILVFSISIDAEGDRAIDVAFRFSSFVESVPISMNCKMFLSVENKEASAFKVANHLFQTNDFWHFPLPFKTCDIPHKTRSLITMEIMVSDGFSIGMKSKAKTEFFTNFTPIRDLQKLSTDIYWLAINNGCYATDCYLEGPNLKKCEAHRAILWARWPQLRPVLDQLGEDGCMKINIEESLLEDILSYMYTGNCEKISTRTAEKVLDVNETVPIPEPLLVKCRSILENGV